MPIPADKLTEKLGDQIDIKPDPNAEVKNISLREHISQTVKGYDEEKEVKEDEEVKEDDEVLDEEAQETTEESEEEVGGEETTDETKDTEEQKKEEDKDAISGSDESAKQDGQHKGKDGDAAEGSVAQVRIRELSAKWNDAQREIERQKPVLENYGRITKFCAENQITPEQFDQAMRVQALLNTNPAEALKSLLPIVEQLQGYVGNKLPEDLQNKVDNGKMELEDARELAKARAQIKYGEVQAKQSREQFDKQRHDYEMVQYTNAAGEWEKAKRTSDPDYKPKANDDAPDGLWETVRDKYLAYLNKMGPDGKYANPVRNSSEMVALMEKAYANSKALWTRGGLVNGKPPTKKKLGGRESSVEASKGETIEGAKTMRDAIRIGLAQRSNR